jgi:hypothetical protein
MNMKLKEYAHNYVTKQETAWFVHVTNTLQGDEIRETMIMMDQSSSEVLMNDS